ncbi:hypothetical protein JCM33374_g1249 [Metschnikowia sp. JCM 33374]|nr:hypothetical protein JCM33374_g1249 [Metschnikowia sp. JCM 33374]
MDDEPPEVQQYKTCAKCRIIERTKKKSRKPLAEETMRYGMRQFQEQSQNSNFIHDDIFANEQLMADMQTAAAHDAALMNSSKPQSQQQQPYGSQQYSMYKQTSAPQYTSALPMGAPTAAPDASSYSYLYANTSPYAGAAGTPGVGSVGAGVGGAAATRPPSAPSANSPVFQSPPLTQQTPQNVVATQPVTSAASYNNPTSSATAAAIAAAAIKRTDASIGSSQTLNRSQNHYRQYQQKQQGGDRARLSAATNCELCGSKLDADDSMSAMYRLCRSCYSDPYARPNVYSDFNDFLLAVVRDRDVESVTYISELASYLVESLSSNRAINSEEQFRKIMMESFSSIYVDPLIGSLTPLAFNSSSNNVNEVNHTAPIISKISQQYHYTLTPPLRINYIAESETGITTIDMTFITETNLIIMKKTTKKATQVYETLFLKSLDEKMRAKGFTFDEEPSKLYEHLDIPLQKDQFVKDFKSLQKQIADIRATEIEISQEDVSVIEPSFEQNGTESEHKPEVSLEPQEKQTPAEVGDEASESEPQQSLEKAPESASSVNDGQEDESVQNALKDTHEPGELDPAFAS